MADEELELEESEDRPAGLKRKIIIAVVALLFLGGSGAGAYWYLNSGEVDQMAAADSDVEDEDSGSLFSAGKEKAIYHRLRPNFVTTFEANSKQRYVQMEVTLVTRQKEVIGALITHKPVVRNALVRVIGAQNYLELQTLDGKEKLRAAALAAVQEVLIQEMGSAGVEKVLFTNFVMQ